MVVIYCVWCNVKSKHFYVNKNEKRKSCKVT
uniref:Uncharacterized protein n=1 Tax=Rhizophora mucronata TaxID=61149 RepID=A0A2P2Q2X4_RHIMU